MPATIRPSLTFEPLHPTFGAKCHGVDFSQPVSAETIQDIREGMAKYGVLVFPATELDDAKHVAFAENFGELDDSAGTWVQPGKTYRLAPFTTLSDVGNVEDDGSVSPVTGPRHQVNAGNGLFHVDMSYNSRRAGFSMLRAHKLPPKGTGGGTAFADTRTAYEDLTPETKEKIKDAVLHHSLWHSRRLGAPDSELLKQVDPEAYAMARHKLVQVHEPSGRTNLYIASHAHHFDDMSREASQPLIDELRAHASQDKYVFQYNWENDGDLVVWDNTCVMHRACGGSFAGKYIRDMRRASTHDNSSTAWGLNEKGVSNRAGLFSSEMKGNDWEKHRK